MGQRLWRAVLLVAQKLGRVQAWLLLSGCYFLFVAPLALIFQALADPLRLRTRSGPSWWKASVPADRWVRARSQS